MDAATPRRHSALLEGCIDSIPICVSFAFVFFSVGSLCITAGYSQAQAVSMTAAIFAGPLQVFIIQNAETVSVAALAAACVLINFRFLIMSSALSEKFREVSLLKLLLCIPMLSASTFTLANNKPKMPGQTVFDYYLGVGIAAFGTALLATAIGSVVSAKTTPYITSIVNMILPVHFAALTGMMWPKLKPVLATLLTIFLAPIAGHWLGQIQVIVLPILIGALFLLWEKSEKQSRR